jgi:polyisoprenyl-teichoic acid--peptidoglycan teichoic acid transferase
MYKSQHSRIDRVTKKRRRKMGKRALIAFSILGVGTLIFAIAQLWGTLMGSHDDLGKSNLRENQINLNKDPFAILLIGSDAREEKSHNWRPDVMMIAAINPKKKTMKMISIPRDTWVEIANTNGGKAKINHAAHYGYVHGVDPVKNTRETVENFLHIPIDYYAKVNFNGFMDAVDILGGIDVNVPRDFSIATFGGEKLHFEKGPMHLDGEHALAYARMRKSDPLGDKGRNMRQHEVLAEIMKKMVSFKAFSQFKDLSTKVGSNVSYSIPPTDILSLVAIYDNIPKQNVETINVQTTFERREGQAVEIVSDEEKQRISRILQQQLEWTPKNTDSTSNEQSEDLEDAGDTEQ